MDLETSVRGTKEREENTKRTSPLYSGRSFLTPREKKKKKHPSKRASPTHNEATRGQSCGGREADIFHFLKKTNQGHFLMERQRIKR